MAYFDKPFTLGQTPPPATGGASFTSNPMIGATIDFLLQAIGGKDSSGTPFFQIPSFSPDRRSSTERLLYNNNVVAQRYLQNMGYSVAGESLANVFGPLGAMAASSPDMMAFINPFLGSIAYQTQDATFGSMLSGIYRNKNQTLRGTGLTSKTPEGDAAALAGLYRSMYTNTWGNNFVNRQSFTYGLTEEAMLPLLQDAINAGAYNNEINDLRVKGQRVNDTAMAVEEQLKGLTPEQRKSYDEATSGLRTAKDVQDYYSNIQQTSQKQKSDIEKRYSDKFSTTYDGVEKETVLGGQLTDYNDQMKHLITSRNKAQAELEEKQKKLSGGKLEKYEEMRLEDDIKELKEKIEKYNTAEKEDTESFQKNLAVHIGDEDAKTYIEATKKLIHSTESLTEANKSVNEANKKRDDTLKDLNLDKDKVDKLEKDAEDARQAARDAQANLDRAIADNQGNYNRTISAMTNVYGDESTARQAFLLQYGRGAAKDKNLQDKARKEANLLISAANQAGVDVTSLGKIKASVANRAGSRMGLTDRESEAGWGAGMSLRFGQSAAMSAVLGSVGPDGSVDLDKLGKLTPGFEERWENAANSEQERLQVMIETAAAEGRISQEELAEYRSMLESGDESTRVNGIRRMLKNVYGSYEEGARVFNNQRTINMMRDNLSESAKDNIKTSLERQVLAQDTADTDIKKNEIRERNARHELELAGMSSDRIDSAASQGEYAGYISALDSADSDEARSFKSQLEKRRKVLEERYKDLPESERNQRINDEMNEYVQKYAGSQLSSDLSKNLFEAGRSGRAGALENLGIQNNDAITTGKLLDTLGDSIDEMDDNEREQIYKMQDLMSEGKSDIVKNQLSDFRTRLAETNPALALALDKLEQSQQNSIFKDKQPSDVQVAGELGADLNYSTAGSAAISEEVKNGKSKAVKDLKDKIESDAENLDKAVKVESEKPTTHGFGIGMESVEKGQSPLGAAITPGANLNEIGENSPLYKAIISLVNLIQEFKTSMEIAAENAAMSGQM